MTGSRGHLQGRRATPATWGLMLVCLWVTVWLLVLGPGGAERASYVLGLTPAVLSGQALLPADLRLLSAPLTLATHLFIHASWAALGTSLLGLWVFGTAVEAACSAPRLLLIFLVCGIAAGLAATVAVPPFATPLTGAGSAVTGLLGARVALSPTQPLALPAPLTASAVPLWPAVLAWLSLQLLLPAPVPLSAVVLQLVLAIVVGTLGIMFLKRVDVPMFR